MPQVKLEGPSTASVLHTNSSVDYHTKASRDPQSDRHVNSLGLKITKYIVALGTSRLLHFEWEQGAWVLHA